MAGFAVEAGHVTVYGAALQAMIDNPFGPVGYQMQLRANAVWAKAVARCPVESEESARRHHRRSGRLKASIYVMRETGTVTSTTAAAMLEKVGSAPAGGNSYIVGSDLVYARRIEFNAEVGGYLRGALDAAGGTLYGGTIR